MVVATLRGELNGLAKGNDNAESRIEMLTFFHFVESEKPASFGG